MAPVPASPMKTILPVPHCWAGIALVSLPRSGRLPQPRGKRRAAQRGVTVRALRRTDLLYWRRPGADPPIYLLGRTGPLEAQLAARLGIGFQEVRPASPEAAWAWLRTTLAAGQPALVLADVGELPYLNARTHFTGHRLLVIGIDDQAGTLFVLDNDRAGVQEIAQAAFDASWRSTAFPAPIDYRYYEVHWPAALPDSGARIREAVAETVRLLDGQSIPFVDARALPAPAAAGWRGWRCLWRTWRAGRTISPPPKSPRRCAPSTSTWRKRAPGSAASSAASTAPGCGKRRAWSPLSPWPPDWTRRAHTTRR